jgi:hypothetical protein
MCVSCPPCADAHRAAMAGTVKGPLEACMATMNSNTMNCIHRHVTPVNLHRIASTAIPRSSLSRSRHRTWPHPPRRAVKPVASPAEARAVKPVEHVTPAAKQPAHVPAAPAAVRSLPGVPGKPARLVRGLARGNTAGRRIEARDGEPVAAGVHDLVLMATVHLGALVGPGELGAATPARQRCVLSEHSRSIMPARPGHGSA